MPALEWIFIVTASSFVALVAWSLFTTYEINHNKRLLLAGVRNRIDTLLEQISKTLSLWYITITRHKVKLSWYYSIHTVLVAILAFLGRTYTTIEAIVLRNRDKAKQIRREKKIMTRTHLTEIAEHKVSVKLSEKEQTKRKEASLKGK